MKDLQPECTLRFFSRRSRVVAVFPSPSEVAIAQACTTLPSRMGNERTVGAAPIAD